MTLHNGPISLLAPGVLAASAAAKISLAEPCGRLSLRARGNLAALDEALHLVLPVRIGQRASQPSDEFSAGGIAEAICLGPDEWKLHVPNPLLARIIARCANVYEAHPHSLVDISGREVTLEIEGPRAAELLTIGCPRDIHAMPVGEGRRTVFDGVMVVIWREASDRFRMDIWNSFAPHLLALLETGSRELAAETAWAPRPAPPAVSAPRTSRGLAI